MATHQKTTTRSPEEQAKDFIRKIEKLFAGRDDLIYEFDASVKKSNVISPSKVGNRHAHIEVTLFNVSDPDDLFGRETWMHLGDIGASVTTYDGDYYNDYNPWMEISTTFES